MAREKGLSQRSYDFCESQGEQAYSRYTRNQAIFHSNEAEDNNSHILRHFTKGQKIDLRLVPLPQQERISRWLANAAQEEAPGIGTRARPVQYDDNVLTAGIQNTQHVMFENSAKEKSFHQPKRRIKSSSGSSFLERCFVDQPQSRKFGSIDNPNLKSMQLFPQSKKRKQLEHESPSSENGRSSTKPCLIVLRENFEKKKRHKTKEDRYNPHKETQKSFGQRKDDCKGQKLKIKRLRGKAPSKYGEDLMNNFYSKSIGHDRLTMRPSQNLGLFKHGRASSPLMRRGLPDLAFSEMEFLHHTKKDQPEGEHLRPTANNKEKSRREQDQAQNEISSYFSARKLNLHDMRPKFYGSQSPKSQEEVTRHPSSLHTPKHAFVSKEDFQEPVLNFSGHDSRLKETATASDLHLQMSPTDCITKNFTRLSNRSATVCTWSTSSKSPETSCNKQQRSMSGIDSRSLTPQSIRIALQKSGVFEGTGIAGSVNESHGADRTSSNARLCTNIEKCEQGFPEQHMQASAIARESKDRDFGAISTLQEEFQGAGKSFSVTSQISIESSASESGKSIQKPTANNTNGRTRHGSHGKDLDRDSTKSEITRQREAEKAYVRRPAARHAIRNSQEIQTRGGLTVHRVAEGRLNLQNENFNTSVQPTTIQHIDSSESLDGTPIEQGDIKVCAVKQFGEPITELFESIPTAVREEPSCQETTDHTTSTVEAAAPQFQSALNSCNVHESNNSTFNVRSAAASVQFRPPGILYPNLPVRGYWPACTTLQVSDIPSRITCSVEPLYSHQMNGYAIRQSNENSLLSNHDFAHEILEFDDQMEAEANQYDLLETPNMNSMGMKQQGYFLLEGPPWESETSRGIGSIGLSERETEPANGPAWTGFWQLQSEANALERNSDTLYLQDEYLYDGTYEHSQVSAVENLQDIVEDNIHIPGFWRPHQQY